MHTSTFAPAPSLSAPDDAAKPSPLQEVPGVAADADGVRALLQAVPAERLQAPRPDLKSLQAAAASLAAEASQPALAARLLRLPREEFDSVVVARLPLALAALAKAREELDAALSPPTEVAVSAELVERAGVLKERMLRVARYHFEDDAELGRVLAGLQRKRTGSGELAADLRRLARVYEERKGALSADTRHYRAADATDASAVADEIGAQLSAVGGEAIRKATDSVARAQALLVATYDEVRAAVLFLLRSDPKAAERMPPSTGLPAGRGRPRRTTVAQPVAPSDEGSGPSGPAAPEPA